MKSTYEMKTQVLKHGSLHLIYREEVLMHYTTDYSLGRKSSNDLVSQGLKSCQAYLIDTVVTP